MPRSEGHQFAGQALQLPEGSIHVGDSHARPDFAIERSPQDLGHPQARAVGDAERGIVLEARRGFEETRHFLLAQHLRQVRAFALAVTLQNLLPSIAAATARAV
jgi:hypothetical protein